MRVSPERSELFFSQHSHTSTPTVSAVIAGRRRAVEVEVIVATLLLIAVTWGLYWLIAKLEPRQ